MCSQGPPLTAYVSYLIVGSVDGCTPRLVFTIRRDLSSIMALHAELDRVLKEERERGREIYPPAFPDPFYIGMAASPFQLCFSC